MAKNQRQFEFCGTEFEKPGAAFGGSLLKGNAKTKRPLSTKLPVHLTMRAQRSVLRLPRTFRTVAQIIEDTARKYGVTVYKQANVGNHLHLVIKVGNLRLWAPFIRELAGRIAQAVMDTLRANGVDWNGLAVGFWKFKPHTRIVGGWRKAFRSALQYVELNQLEAEGFISRRETKSLRDLRAIWADG